MGISNCASYGPNSYADPVTGIVSERNKMTGATEAPTTSEQNAKATGPNVKVATTPALDATTFSAAANSTSLNTSTNSATALAAYTAATKL